ncbi:MAG TPA: tetratricopeptide repeat protein [Ktedonobacteraceae bacterium]|jgi:tetratricopeptide (TPR) repeat protein/transcriptional regulator with XRE-family HTH domain
MQQEISGFDWKRWIRSEREKHGWTQQELAQQLGIAVGTVYRWESGERVPRISIQERLQNLFEGQLEEMKKRSNSFPAVFDHHILDHPVTGGKLIGRDPLVRQLKQALRAHSGSFALWGMAGVGKTALAATLAHDRSLQTEFADGILWAGLGPNPSLSYIFSRWATLLDLDETEGAKVSSKSDWQTLLREKIGRRRMLIIIDDVWKAEDAFDLRCAGPQCIYLLTGRSQEIAIEFTRSKERVYKAEELDADDGLDLLADFVPEIVNIQNEAKKLVKSVGGLPLALTIIGARLQKQGANDQPHRVHRALLRLLRQKEERLHLAMLLPPSERPPHLPENVSLSLYATIEVSEQQLPEKARYALHALSVFRAKPRSFSEEAALQLGGFSIEELDILVDANLLESYRHRRYILHQTIADYASLHLRDKTVVKDPEAVEERMVMYFVTYAENHVIEDQALEREIENIIDACKLASQGKMLAVQMRGIAAIAPYLERRGLYALVESCLQNVRQKASVTGEVRLVANACLHLGRIAQFGKEPHLAETHYEEGVKLAREIQDRFLLRDLLASWGEARVYRGDHLEAKDILQEALAITQESGGNPRSMGILLRVLGEVESSNGNNGKANLLFEQGLSYARQIHDMEIISTILQDLGVGAERSGAYQQAETCYEEGLTCAKQAKYRQRISAILMNMGMLAFKQKNYNKAEELYLESMEIARKTRAPVQVRISSVLQNLGMLERVRGKYSQAAIYLQESLEIAYRIEHKWLISETLYELGELHLEQNNITEANKAFTMALEIAQKINGKELIAFAEYGLAKVTHTRGEDAKAREWGIKSQEAFQGTDNEAGKLVEELLKTLP